MKILANLGILLAPFIPVSRCARIVEVRMTEEGCLPPPVSWGKKTGIYTPSSHSSFWCNLLRGGATCHREREAAHPSSPFSSFQLPLLLFLFSFLFFRHIGAIYGLVQEGGEIEGRGGRGSDKSLVVKRGDHGGGERRGGEGVQSFARPKVFHPWNRIYVYIFFDGGGNSWDSMIWMELSSTWDKPSVFQHGNVGIEFFAEILIEKHKKGKLIDATIENKNFLV